MLLAYSRRAALLALASAAMVFTRRAPTTYPSRPVKIIVPFGAGGPTDVFVREIAVELQKSLHQTFVIENRPGAGTTIGTDLRREIGARRLHAVDGERHPDGQRNALQEQALSAACAISSRSRR